MKITNVETGETLQLTPGTKLSVERTNPFFNGYGEQTVPLDIPASPHNCRILGHPESFGVKRKAIMKNAVIQDGEYYAQCRQAVLSATRHGSISTSFYMSDGSLYSRIGNIKLRDIYGDERIAAAGSTVASCIAWCKTLVNNTNEDYTIFPVLVTDDSDMDEGWTYKILNNYGCMWPVYFPPGAESFDDCPTKIGPLYLRTGKTPVFENESDTVEYVDGMTVNLKPGYYISPFVRAVRVLKDVFAHFGYRLLDNFFTQTQPFDKMAIVNNCIDTIVNGYILKADLVPDITCKDFLAVFRKKFCCEFVSNEKDMTVNVVFLKDVLNMAPSADLTHNMTAEPTFSFKSQKDFKRVKLTSEHKVDAESSDSFDSVKEMANSHETAVFCWVDGAFYKRGWKGFHEVETKVAESSMDYDSGDQEVAEEISIPDLQPEYRILYHVYKTDEGEDVKRHLGRFLYIGDYVARHSKLKSTNVVSDSDGTSDDSTKATSSPCILAFTHTDPIHFAGTAGSISAYNHYFGGVGIWAHGSYMNTRGYTKIFDYSLFYWGEDGIFEKFYRPMDLLLRNTLNEVKAKLLLSTHHKMNIPACEKVCIRGEEFLINKLKFTVGGKDEPEETSLLTLTMVDDPSVAATVTESLPMMTAEYHWELRSDETTIEWWFAGREEDTPYHSDGEFHSTVYPPLPSADLVGQPYGEQTTYTLISDDYSWREHDGMWGLWHQAFYRQTKVWLECVHN